MIVSFINFKGGVGKTTLCVEIAAALAKSNGSFREKVLIIDLDPQTNATLSLMSEPEWLAHSERNGTLLNFFEACKQKQNFDLASIIVKSPVNHKELLTNLDIIPSHINLFNMDLQLATKFGNENIETKLFLNAALSKIQNEYSYIFIDCPPNLHFATQNGLFTSDCYVIVALAEYLSTLGIAHIIHSIQDIFENANKSGKTLGMRTLPPPSLLGIIFNRLRTLQRGTYSQENMIRSIIEKYPNYVFKTHVPESYKIAERAEKKVPIAVSGYAADFDYESRMKALAKEFYGRITSMNKGNNDECNHMANFAFLSQALK
jgi:chromosome partitioning protein